MKWQGALARRCHQEPIPRVACMAETFAEWEAKAEAFEQYTYGCGNSDQRSLFDMLGQTVFLETHFPWSFFKQVKVRAIAADFTIRKNSKAMKLAKKHGGEWEEGYYMADGYGWPLFGGEDGLERCFAFLKEWKS